MLAAVRGDDALAVGLGYEGDIHLLLTDVVMPGMNGRDLALQLADKRPTLRVLFMSGYTDDVVIHHGVIEAGMSFLGKPFTPRSLAQRIRQTLSD
ncbi:MAG: response regulator [Myxococcales bacterium]|nr:MAG: response regulator [Myxococcales bacterium]